MQWCVLFFCMGILLSSFSENEKASQFYNKKGQLIAHPEFSISAKQLKKWKAIEKQFISVLSEKIEYPAMEHEAGMVSQIIFSFTVDENGKWDHYAVACYDMDTTNVSGNITAGFKKFPSNALKAGSAHFQNNSFVSAAGKKEVYFFPVRYIISKSKQSSTVVKEGWLTIEKSEKKQEPIKQSHTETIHFD